MIEIRGARSNNLRSVDVDVPHERLVVITGLSGSGKSSLALQTLYAEGQRRYVESLSAYARQFLGRLQKPEVDSIHGLPPAIALEQRVQSRNPRSTVGTMTEVYEYLRLLFARVGHTFSPASGQEVRKQTADDAVRIMQQYSPGTRFLVLCRPKSTIETLRSQGFARIEVGGQVRDINEYEPREGDDVLLVIDRMQAGSDTDTLSRLTDSAETALWEGAGEMMLRFMPAGILHTITTRLELDGMRFEEPTDQLFAFNSPMGACPECEGYGKVVGIDERLVVPDTSLSVQAGAVVPWRGEKLGDWRKWFVRLNQPRGFPVHKPYYELSAAERDWLWHGTLPEGSTLSKEEEEWGPLSIDAFFESLRQAQYKIQNRVMLARYRGKTLCPTCRGARLRKEATYVMVGGRRITELVEMPVKELRTWMQRLALPPHEETIAKRLLKEIRSRLDYICDVGLGYLTLNRPAQTLSGGESQRLGLATQIGSSLVGSLYILDEPSIGLHSRDTERLIAILKQLRDAGNTVVVVEHDEEIIRAADWIIDLGPEAGELGGEVVYAGPPMPTKVKKKDIRRSHTLRYLLGQETMALPKSRRPWNQYIEVQGARANNLRGIDVRFPLNVLTCITGVSGSGKSSLVHDILYLALRRHFDQANELPGEHQGIAGDLEAISAVEFVDQHPIGRSSRSNPVTYIHAWDDIRRLYAQQPAAQAQGFGAGHFSFNTDGGRCEECKGEGKTAVELQF